MFGFAGIPVFTQPLGKPLAGVPAVQARLANLLLEMETARGALGRGLDWLADGAKGAPLPLWMGKIAVTWTAAHVVDECLAMHGAIGYSRGLPLERHARDVKAFGIHWGNNDVLLDLAGLLHKHTSSDPDHVFRRRGCL